VKTNVAVKLQLVDVYLELGRLDDARRLLDELLAKGEGGWVARTLDGHERLRRHDLVGARTAYRAARETIDPRTEAVDLGMIDYVLRYADLLDDGFG
jgi:FimV-like protein